MPLAIDFGTSNTVAALWDADMQDARSLPLADLTVTRTDPHGREFHVVPSLMHFHERGQRFLSPGRQAWVGRPPANS